MSGTDSRLKVLWHWHTMGPYHFARMKALAERREISLSVVETCSVDDHGWRRKDTDVDGFQFITVSNDSNRLQAINRRALAQLLRFQKPDIVVTAGYAWVRSLITVLRYRYSNPASVAVLWSESTAMDNPRNRLKETLKSLFVSAFEGALVAGQLHERYLTDLGMNPLNIQAVGNCVDNEFFTRRTAEERQKLQGHSHTDALPANFFLYVGRIIPEKNLSRLVEAYHLYREHAPVEP